MDAGEHAAGGPAGVLDGGDVDGVEGHATLDRRPLGRRREMGRDPWNRPQALVERDARRMADRQG